MTFISQKLRDSAKGQQCTLRIPGVCNDNPETTVLCHINSPLKGMGNKSPDWWAVFGCSDCHEAMDMHRTNMFSIEEALFRTWAIWLDMGLLIFPETVKKRKPLSKVMPRRLNDGQR